MTDLTAMLADLVGPGGRLEVAFRAAVHAPAQRSADRWQPVLNELHDALGLAVGLATDQTEPPTSTPYPAKTEPCARCAGVTAMRIYGRPWHYTCWVSAGSPITAAATPPAATEPTRTSAETAPAAPDAGSLANAGADPVQAANGQTRSQNGGPELARRFELSDDEEMADWSREIRKRYPDATDAQSAAALQAWRRHVTYSGDPVRFVSSAGYTGVAVYEWLVARRGGMTRPEPLQNETVLELTGARTKLAVLSFVDRDQPVAAGQAVTELDVNAQYLASARSAELGDGEPVQLGPVDPSEHAATFKRPGYVQLGSRPTLDGLPATARLPYEQVDAGWWLPTPTARYLQHDHGLTLDIAAAWIWPASQHGRRLSVWAGLFADARTALTAARDADDDAAGMALRVLKSVYATFLGGMTRSAEHNDKGTLRPDWHDQYVTQASVNALRALDKVRNTSGASPIGLMKDSAWFVTEPDAAPFTPPGLVISEQPGKWHINRWGLVDDNIVRRHASGRIGTLRKAITAADNARTGTTATTTPDDPADVSEEQ